MKKNIQVIEVEGYLIAVDEKAPEVNSWIIDPHNKIRQVKSIHENGQLLKFTDDKVMAINHCKKIIAIQSTHPRASELGLPTFEVESQKVHPKKILLQNKIELDDKFDVNNLSAEFNYGFILGYKLALQHKGFSEEDMRTAYRAGEIAERNDTGNFYEFLQSLKQQELKIEWEEAHGIKLYGGVKADKNNEYYKPLTNDKNQLISESGELITYKK